jgi:ATP-binding cassette subfamily B protein
MNDIFKKFAQPLSNTAFLLKAYLRHSKLVAVGGVAQALIANPIQTYIGATVAQAVISSVQETRQFAPALTTALIYFAVNYAFTLGNWAWIDFYVRRKSVEIEAKIEREIYEHAVKVDMRHMDDPKYYDAYKLATEEFVGQAPEAYDAIINLLGYFARIATLIAVLARTGAPIIALIAVLSLVGLAINLYWNTQAGKRSKAQLGPRRRRDYTRRLMFNTAAAGDVRATRLMRFLMGSYDEGIEEQGRVMRSFAKKEFFTDIVQTVTQNIALYVVVLYVAYGFVTGKITDIGVFATLIAASELLSGNLQNLSYTFSRIHRVSVFGAQAREFFDVEPGIERSDGDEPPDGPLSLELRDLSFAYPSAEPTLKHVSIKVPRGQKIAIVGENGAGKTTLSKLLLRLYDVSDGAVLINGRDIREYDIHALRSRVGSAFQTANVYPLTLAENLQLYRDCDTETLQGIIDRVRLTKAPGEQLTREFDDKGAVMSGGEAQKIGLGRLLTGGFGLLILDEPSSSLDPLAEYELAQLMFDKSRSETTVMIAHRLSTVVNADRIYLISGGEIAESGTHAELMALGGGYAEMFTKQAENYSG